MTPILGRDKSKYLVNTITASDDVQYSCIELKWETLKFVNDLVIAIINSRYI